MTQHHKDALFHWAKLVSTLIGTAVLVGGLIVSAFGAWYSFERKSDAAAKRSVIWKAVARKEDKADAQKARKEVSEAIDKHFASQARVNEQILDELKTVRQRTWELVQDR